MATLILGIANLKFNFGWVRNIFMNIILALVYKKNVKLFRIVTLNQIDSNKFYHDHVHESESGSHSDNSDSDDENEDNSKLNISDININLQKDESLDFSTIFDMKKFDQKTLDALQDVQAS